MRLKETNGNKSLLRKKQPRETLGAVRTICRQKGCRCVSWSQTEKAEFTVRK